MPSWFRGTLAKSPFGGVTIRKRQSSVTIETQYPVRSIGAAALAVWGAWPPPRAPWASSAAASGKSSAVAAIRIRYFMFRLLSLSWTLPAVCILEQLPNAGIFHWPRIVIRIFGGKLGRAVEAFSRHADIFQCERRAQARGEIIKPLCGVTNTERPGSDLHRLRRRFTIKFHSMRQHDGVCFGMRKIECAPK